MAPTAAVDIGTNSMRLLIVDGDVELGRWQEVTGLGRGVGADGNLTAESVGRTVDVLSRFGDLLRSHQVSRVRAVATAASRGAPNREWFFDRAEEALGIRPELIGGEEEARLAFSGATADLGEDGNLLVIDIGGGSTEFVTADGAVSFEVGSVRLTDQLLADRPAAFEDLAAAAEHVENVFERVPLPTTFGSVIGVAGTWTSLAAIHLGLPAYDRAAVHHSVLQRLDIDRLVERLAALSLTETEAIPALDPGRAPVILAGAVVARGCLRILGADQAVVSEQDLLDGVVASLVDGTG